MRAVSKALQFERQPSTPHELPIVWTSQQRVRLIALLVALLYFGSSFFFFRGVIASIPDILAGKAVINGDELVPFFNPVSQLIDQAAGKFNQLTHGYEFRVRYAFLTTWMRYYKILPFAIVLVIPGITFAGYLAVSIFLSRSFKNLAPETIYTASAAPVAVIFLILTYSKITHFYTLILGFSMFLIAVTLVTYGLLFATRRPYRPIAAAALVTLFNPAVHYLILFALYQSMTVGGLLLLEGIRFVRLKPWQFLPQWREWLPYLRPAWLWQHREAILQSNAARAIIAMIFLGSLALVPYALFVKFIALRGVPNLSETVPGDFYFITDASIPIAHLLSLDMAGIMDKMMTGDYLAREPRYANMVYTVSLLLPLFWPQMRRRLFNTAARRRFLFVAYLNVFFSMWATLGYSEPAWLPTFHRTIAAISLAAYGMESVVGDLILKVTSTIVQVLRFPHRFELILFMMACILMPLSLAQLIQWIQERLQEWGRWSSTAWRRVLHRAIAPGLTLLFFVPLFSNWQYRETFLSGDFRQFLAPYPVTLLKEVKSFLQGMPPGKVVVLPPTETAKVVVDLNGVEHKFIDKFHIYYLDLPSYYYGLTGDSDNKFEFFLLLRALYYQQDWWVNIARDLNLRYIVVNRELIANTVGGAEYLREIEKIILPELDQLPQYLHRVYENASYVVYQFTDLPKAARVPLFIDMKWSDFIAALSSNLALTRCYDLRHPVVSDDLTDYEQLVLLTDEPRVAALDLYIKAHPERFFSPSSSILAFNPNIVPSSYYLSPMFRLFQFFSDSKWNRLHMITPGLFGTIKGSFIGVPRPTKFRIDVKFPAPGRYRLLLRGAATVNALEMRASSLQLQRPVTLKAQPGWLDFYDQREVFTSQRTPLDISRYTLEELEQLIPTQIVAVNNRYQYFDLGTVEVNSARTAIFYFNKQDSNPLLVEGVLAIPDETYQRLDLPANVRLVQSARELGCQPLTAP
ncbi:hypothetical protein FKZ61_001690 [Litorilinea aerophila]|uniref:Uncharacterized protein n=1 Tax=Litorilinea aerophila TaxID=1204385 RepID=A0A540VLH9_9CHLR|nr:hypothetical protein [Litorilinea aerophila]MCC9074830.1 hypothetical protein [Litorilinea aerophila]